MFVCLFFFSFEIGSGMLFQRNVFKGNANFHISELLYTKHTCGLFVYLFICKGNDEHVSSININKQHGNACACYLS